MFIRTTYKTIDIAEEVPYDNISLCVAHSFPLFFPH